MSSSNELNAARMKLEEELGEVKKLKYYNLLKQWFKMKSTREEFYCEARKLLSPDHVCLHNRFVLNLFNTCQFPINFNQSPHSVRKPLPAAKSSPLREKEKDKEKDKSKREKVRPRKRTRSDRGFEPADPSDSRQTLPPQALDEPMRYLHEELFLPDTSLLHGRILLCSWDHDLEGGSDVAAEYLAAAVQYLLKNILTAVFSQRSGYKVRENRFRYALGTSVPNQWLRNSAKIKNYSKDFSVTEIDEESDDVHVPGIRPTSEELEQRAAFEMACCTIPMTVKPPVTAFHLLETLISEPNIIPNRRVYTENVERIYARLNHPSHEELTKNN